MNHRSAVYEETWNIFFSQIQCLMNGAEQKKKKRKRNHDQNCSGYGQQPKSWKWVTSTRWCTAETEKHQTTLIKNKGEFEKVLLFNIKGTIGI